MNWPISVTVAGAAIPLDEVLADLVIHHGRVDIGDQATPTTCQLTVLGATHEFVEAFHVGAAMEVLVADGAGPVRPRFTGRVTDASLTVGDLTVIGAGLLSTFGQYEIGTVPWPIETWSSRVFRCFTEAGLDGLLDFYPDPRFDPQLAARDPETAGPTTLADYLNFLAPMVGAAIADRMNGRILVQAIGARTLADAIALDPAEVAYSPPWTQVLPTGNVVTVRYTGDQSESVTVRDEASIAVFGERPETIDTSFVNVADAGQRASTRLARGAFPHWNMAAVPVLRGMDLAIGIPVEVSGTPPPSPYDPWTPIVEGWTDQISGPDWTMTLALSDPLASGLVLPWEAVPIGPAYLWNTIDQTTVWADALTLGDLSNA